MAELSTKPEIKQVSIEADARLRAALAAVLAGAAQ
jgi:hypothetical protein